MSGICEGWEARIRPGRLGSRLYLGIFLLFWLAVAAKAEIKMSSMLRISLPIYVCLVLATLNQLRRFPIQPTRKWLWIAAVRGVASRWRGD